MGGNAKAWGEKPKALTRAIWNQLIRRNSNSWRPHDEDNEVEGPAVQEAEEREAEAGVAPPEKKVELADLVVILRLMEVPSSLLQDLLEVICERFNLPDEPEEPSGEGRELFQVSCSSDDSHLVSPVGFLLLDSNALLICAFLIYIGIWLGSIRKDWSSTFPKSKKQIGFFLKEFLLTQLVRTHSQNNYTLYALHTTHSGIVFWHNSLNLTASFRPPTHHPQERG